MAREGDRTTGDDGLEFLLDDLGHAGLGLLTETRQGGQTLLDLRHRGRRRLWALGHLLGQVFSSAENDLL